MQHPVPDRVARTELISVALKDAGWSEPVFFGSVWPSDLFTFGLVTWLCPAAGLTLAVQPAVSLEDKPSQKFALKKRKQFQLGWVAAALQHPACWRWRDRSGWHCWALLRYPSHGFVRRLCLGEGLDKVARLQARIRNTDTRGLEATAHRLSPQDAFLLCVLTFGPFIWSKREDRCCHLL